MFHVILDPTKLVRYHVSKTKIELWLTKAKLESLRNKPEKGFLYLGVAESIMNNLELFVMICEQSCIATSEGALELVNKGIVKDIELEKRK